ncbi:MAG TPA: hypothetical protein ENG33_10990 [Chloroflexi bacterium]|nr:hypothetical protein [Chloroflexota bacterium]
MFQGYNLVVTHSTGFRTEEIIAYTLRIFGESIKVADAILRLSVFGILRGAQERFSQMPLPSWRGRIRAYALGKASCFGRKLTLWAGFAP